MLELHYFPSNASLAPHILLEELGVPFELKLVDRHADAHKSPQYLKLNPNGLIPVLVDGDVVLYETPAILLQLVDTHAERGFAPPSGTPQRAEFYKWLMWMSNTLHAKLIVYFYPHRLVDEGHAEAAAEVQRHAERNACAMLDRLDAHLASHGGPWMLGDTYSACDPFAFMLCRWTRAFARPARSLPHLGPYLQRMLARPAVQRAIATERLAEPLV